MANTSEGHADLTQALLSAIVESSDDAIISKNLDGIITSWNKSAERLFGYTADEAIGNPVLMLIPQDRKSEEPAILDRLRRGERVDHFETVRVRKDGTLLDLSLTISPIRDSTGRVVGASKIARDITEQKRTEKLMRELQQKYAESLEERVERATADLSTSQERLRTAERLAALGTLSAGLGHDMGNVLMPLRARIETIASQLPTNDGFRDHFDAIRKAIEYLHTLASGLRMLAIDPTYHHGSPGMIRLEQWWEQTHALLRTSLGRQFALESHISPDLPPLAIPNHLLTQAVFNLVQNAGQAMSGPAPQPDGRVCISAASDGEFVRVIVADNGPGMSSHVRDRCLEPYFSTKTRGISTGLGLTIVHGIVQSVKGTLQIDSQPGQGASFILRIPIARTSNGQKPVASVDVKNARLRALLGHLLTAQNFVMTDEPRRAHLLVTDDSDAAEMFISRNSTGHVLLLDARVSGPAADSLVDSPADLPANSLPGESSGILRVGPQTKTADLRMALLKIIGSMGVSSHDDEHIRSNDQSLLRR